jgi:hypothetical protein
VWVKPSTEMQFLYGNHVLKGGLGRITENTPAYTGVVVYSMSDVPLGFGVSAKSTNECRGMDPNGIVVFHQGDVGEAARGVGGGAGWGGEGGDACMDARPPRGRGGGRARLLPGRGGAGAAKAPAPTARWPTPVCARPAAPRAGEYLRAEDEL